MLHLIVLQNSNANEPRDVAEIGQSAQTTITDLINGFFAQLPLIVIGAAVILFFWLLAFIARKTIRSAFVKANVDLTITSLTARITYLALIALGVFISATVIFPGLSPGDLVAALGIGSVALGFAFKDVLQNLFAGFLILLYRPFILGDEIKIDTFSGEVEEINLRATRIKTFEGERVVIPNSELYMKSVLVRTAYPQRRTRFVIGIGYGEDHERAREILLEVLENSENVLDEPKPAVDVIELGDSSINLELLYWTESKQRSTRIIRDKVFSASKSALDQAGIEIPFPQRVVTMAGNGKGPE